MRKNKEKLIIERHRPRTLDEYVFQDNTMKQKIQEYLDDGDIPHLLLSGVQGTGKTSLARLIIDQLGVEEEDILEINGSFKTKAEEIKPMVYDFIMTFATGDFKVVLVEEADRLSAHAQDSLKVAFEENSDMVRFIFVTNREHLIIPPLKSRFQHYRFKSHKKAKVLQLCCDILDKEEIEYEPEVVLEYIDVCYPDIRKTLNLLQQNMIKGKLVELRDLSTEDGGDWKLVLLDIIQTGKWFDAVDKVVPNLTVEAWEEMYQFVYQNYTKAPFESMPQMKQAVITVAEYLYRHALCADPAINAAAMFATLSEIQS